MSSIAYSFRVVWSDEDEAFVATCPEFEGISGIGESADVALAEAQVALQLMIETYEQENWPLPPPASLQSYSGQFRIRVPRGLHSRLAEAAADEGVSLNTYAVGLLSGGVGEARATKQVQRCIEDVFTRLRGDLLNGFLQQPIRTSASAPYELPSPGHFVRGNATAGGSTCPS
jgi:predicted RNase H-like HicB family nuclease